MPDYMFMLESRLSSDQHRALAHVQSAATAADLKLYLTGGAVRDLLGHFPIVDLDFTVEGLPSKMVKDLAKHAGAKIAAEDGHRKSYDLIFPGGVTVEISMARAERYPKPGTRPQVTPTQIHEDLRRRDFSINAMAISLNPGSRGLLLDPNIGQSDLERRELRTVSNYALYDNPARILRLIRFQARFGFQIEERTKNQLQNAREAGMAGHIDAEAKHRELHAMAEEPKIAG